MYIVVIIAIPKSESHTTVYFFIFQLLSTGARERIRTTLIVTNIAIVRDNIFEFTEFFISEA